jgi:hypothetical protein
VGSFSHVTAEIASVAAEGLPTGTIVLRLHFDLSLPMRLRSRADYGEDRQKVGFEPAPKGGD